MMDRYAIIIDGMIVNMAVWDGITEWVPNDGEPIQAPDGVDIGWLYSDGVFTPPEPPELTQNEQATRAAQRQQALRLIADAEIAWRQDAVDAGIATVVETTALTDWRKYRVALMRIDASKAPNIEWPAQPGMVDN